MYMRRTPSDEAGRWFLQAQRDLDDARYSAAGQRFNLACFLAQQSAEKALKALLYSAGAEAVWGYSVAELCQDIIAIHPDLAPLAAIGGPLDKYYIPTRYPNGLPGGIPSDAFVSADAQMAISMAEQVLDTISSKLTS